MADIPWPLSAVGRTSGGNPLAAAEGSYMALFRFNRTR